MNPLLRMITFSAAGLIAALLAGVVLIAWGNPGLGWWLVLATICGGMMVTATLFRGQQILARRLREADGDLGPGDSHHPVPPWKGASMTRDTRGRWTGAATVPSSLGWAQIGWYMAVAELGELGLLLRVRPGFIRLMFGIENLTVRPGDGTVIYPARAIARSGIEIRMRGRLSYYFWLGERGNLLASLAAAGFEVSTEEQSARR